MSEAPSLKPLVWVGSSLRDLCGFPEPVQDHMGYALYAAQLGGKHRDSKTLSGFSGAGVLEVIQRLSRRYVSRRSPCKVRGRCVRASHFPEETEDRTRDTAPGHRTDSATAARSRKDCRGV